MRMAIKNWKFCYCRIKSALIPATAWNLIFFAFGKSIYHLIISVKLIPSIFCPFYHQYEPNIEDIHRYARNPYSAINY